MTVKQTKAGAQYAKRSLEISTGEDIFTTSWSRSQRGSQWERVLHRGLISKDWRMRILQGAIGKIRPKAHACERKVKCMTYPWCHHEANCQHKWHFGEGLQNFLQHLHLKAVLCLSEICHSALFTLNLSLSRHLNENAPPCPMCWPQLLGHLQVLGRAALLEETC